MSRVKFKNDRQTNQSNKSRIQKRCSQHFFFFVFQVSSSDEEAIKKELNVEVVTQLSSPGRARAGSGGTSGPGRRRSGQRS